MTPGDLSDDDLTMLLEAAAPEVSTEGVVAAVAGRVERRRGARVRRRVASAMGVAATVALVTVGLVVWAGGDDGTLDVAVPSSEPVATTTTTDSGASIATDVRREAVPGDGDSITPLAADASRFWLVRGSSAVDFGSGPRTISRWSADGARGPTTVVEGIPTKALAVSDRLWVVVVEPAVEGPPEWRLKEIRATDGMLLTSTEIPLTAKPLLVTNGARDPGGSFIGIETAAESVQVDTDDHAVVTSPPGPTPVVEAPSVTVPRRLSIEGTDLVERKGTS